MNKQTRILGISGSLRRESYNTALRAAVAKRFDEGGNLTDERTKDLIRKLLQSLVELTQRIQQPLA